jgi:hypothetical protein
VTRGKKDGKFIDEKSEIVCISTAARSRESFLKLFFLQKIDNLVQKCTRQKPELSRQKFRPFYKMENSYWPSVGAKLARQSFPGLGNR